MLPLRLQQIKDRLEEKKFSSELSKEEFKLLAELNFLEDNEKIQVQIVLGQSKRFLAEMIAPAPDKCPACGKDFK